jgi:hypothetical protein
MPNSVQQTDGSTVVETAPITNPLGSAAFATSQVSVASTATLIAAARTGVPGTGRIAISITNAGTTAVYIGGAGVTTSTGTLLVGIAGTTLTFDTTAAVYGIVASTAQTVTVLETF